MDTPQNSPVTQASPVSAPTPTPQEAPPANDYASDPIATARSGLGKWWRNGRQALAGLTGMQLLLFIGGSLGALVSALAFLVLFLVAIPLNNAPEPGTAAASLTQLDAFTSQLPPAVSGVLGFFWNASPAVAVTIGIAGMLVALLLATLSQALALALASNTVINNQPASFGPTMRLALTSFWPLTGQLTLIGLAVLVGFGLPLLLLILAGANAETSSSTNAAGVLLGLIVLAVLFLPLVILGLRFALAPYGIVADNKGSIEGLKMSWRITKGRAWEIAGIVGVTFLISAAVSIFTDSGTALFKNIPILALLFVLLVVVAYAVSAFVSAAIFAERYVQLRTAPANHQQKTGLNVGILVVGLVALIAAGAIGESLNPMTETSAPLPEFQNDESLLPPSEFDNLPPTEGDYFSPEYDFGEEELSLPPTQEQ